MASWLPYKENGFVHNFFTFVIRDVARYRKKVIAENLRLSFPDKTKEELHEISNTYYKNMVAYILETVKSHHRNYSNQNPDIVFTNAAILNDKPGKSNIIIGSHLGNWETITLVMPIFLKRHVVALYKPLSNKAMEVLMKEKRSAYGVEMVAMDAGVKHMAKQQSNTSYLLVADQSPAEAKTGSWIQFLHQPTLFFQGAEILSKRYNMDVFMQEVEKKNGKYWVSYIPLEGKEITKQYAERLEKHIKKHPSLWLWSHKRWKHKPKITLQ